MIRTNCKPEFSATLSMKGVWKAVSSVTHSFITSSYQKYLKNCQIYTKCYARMEIPLKNALSRDKQVNHVVSVYRQ